jgi:peptidoglycan/xylan/chitin deacetylase (PgdA/CDA1 family)
MANPFYDYSAIVDRPPLYWPGGKRLALYIGLNIEHYEIGKRSVGVLDAVAARDPDPINVSWRDYGMRVGVWRITELLDRLGMRPSVLLNADVCHEYPRILETGSARHWAWVAHGRNNTLFAGDPPKLSQEEERAYLADVFDVIERATGSRPKGWLGPLGLAETYATPRLLAELGATYVLDWANDDQPYPLKAGHGGLFSVPYSFELNDLPVFLKNGAEGAAFARMMIDQFDVLYAESREIARVMSICVYPFVMGQPFRYKHFAEALTYIVGHEDVWLATSDDIAAHFASLARDFSRAQAFEEVPVG